MTNSRTAIMSLALAFVGACATATQPTSTVHAPLAGPFALRVGQQALIEGTPVQVTLMRVIEDQRCPTDVTCVSAGYARILVRFLAADASLDTLSLFRDPTMIIHGDYSIRFLDLQPGRLSTSPPDSAAYIATLIVNRYGTLQ